MNACLTVSKASNTLNCSGLKELLSKGIIVPKI